MDDINLKKLKDMDVSVLILLFRYQPNTFPFRSARSLIICMLQVLAL